MNKRTAYSGILLLVIINILNYMDRYILPAIVPAIRQQFHIGYAREGLLGTAFLIVFAVLTIPFAYLADKTVRKNVIGFSVIFWSFISLLTGFVQNFSQLFIVRAALGFGEAGYGSPALSILGSYEKGEHRGVILSLYSAGTLIGTALGFIIGGFIAANFGWRYAFFLVGIPGFIAGLFVFAIHEPEKTEDSLLHEDFTKVLERLLSIKTYIIIAVAYILLTFAIGGTSFWISTYLVDVFHLRLATAGAFAGTLLICGGTLGVLSGGWISDRLYEKDPKTRLIVPIIGSILGGVFVFLALLAHLFILFVILVFMGGIFLSAASGPLYVVLNDVMPKSIRATGFGISGLFSHLLGDALAPSLIGFITTLASLRLSLLVFVPGALLLTGIVCMFGTRSFVEDMVHE